MQNFFTGRLLFVRIILALTTLILIIFGILTIYSVGNPSDPSPGSMKLGLENLWKKQLVFAILGIISFIFLNTFNYRRLGYLSYWIYATVLFLLTLLLIDKYTGIIPDFLIKPQNGTFRWIQIPFIGLSLQPSEICKLAYIILLAWYLRYKSNYSSIQSLIGPFALTVIPMVLILLEPDLGTVMLMMPILFIMLFIAGAKGRHLILIMCCALALSPFLWHQMKNYQRIRISCVALQNNWVRQQAEKNEKLANVLLGQKLTEKDWNNSWGYHIIRSKCAVASGGLYGTGFRQGPFVKYNFLLPERENDFIFASIAHQWGFVGSVILLSLYIVLVWCGIAIAKYNIDPFGRLMAIGIVAMFIVEVIVNVGMTMGLMPITGLTLPFVSYGGSSLLMSITAIGILNNIGRHRFFSVAPKLPR